MIRYSTCAELSSDPRKKEIRSWPPGDPFVPLSVGDFYLFKDIGWRRIIARGFSIEDGLQAKEIHAIAVFYQLSDQAEDEFVTNKPRARPSLRTETPAVVTTATSLDSKGPKTRDTLANIKKLLYRKREAAHALGLSVRSIDAMIADQRLTTRRFGRCVMIPAAEIDRAAKTIIRSDMLEGSGQKGRSA